MVKSIRITALLIMIFHLNQLYSNDAFDDLFNDIEENEDGGGSSRGEYSPLSISGEHEFDFSLPYINTDRFKTPAFNNLFTIKYEKEHINIVSTWKFNIPENRIIPDENYIKMTFGNTIFKAGYNVFSWGYADGQNPTDRLNSKDYSDPLDIAKIPALSVSAEQYFGDFSMEFIYIPVKSSSLFSFDISEKVPVTLIGQENITFVEVNEIEKFVLGGRINYYGVVDLSLSYIYNFDDYYIPEVTVNSSYPGTGTPLAGLVLKNQRVHQIGLSGKTIVDRFGLWFELNYSILEVSGDYFEWTAGFDLNFGKEDQGFFNMQTFGKWCPEYKETPYFSNISEYSDPADFYLELLTRPLQNIESELSIGFVSKISYQLMNDELEPEIVLIYITSLEDRGTFIIEPAFTYKPIDSLTFLLGMNLIYSIEDIELYDTMHKDDNIFLSVKYLW